MIEPITQTSLLMLCSLNIALAVISPGQFAPHIASASMGVFGGLMVQLWTLDTRRPTTRVFCADIMASGFSGYASMVMGVPTCQAIINKLLPEGSQLVFEEANHIGAVVVISGVAGMLGAGLLRKVLDRVNPGWDGKNGQV